jgi:hypothetical protein
MGLTAALQSLTACECHALFGISKSLHRATKNKNPHRVDLTLERQKTFSVIGGSHHRITYNLRRMPRDLYRDQLSWQKHPSGCRVRSCLCCNFQFATCPPWFNAPDADILCSQQSGSGHCRRDLSRRWVRQSRLAAQKPNYCPPLDLRPRLPHSYCVSRPDGRPGNGRKVAGEESPGSMDIRCRITSGGGNPRESATENRPPRA